MSFKNQAMGTLVFQENARKRRECLISLYLMKPSLCCNCKKVLKFTKRNNKFCSKSCSTRFNNTLRAVRTVESKQKTSISLKSLFAPYTRIKFCNCNHCGKDFLWNALHKGSQKYCSKECTRTSVSIKQSLRLSNPNYRKNYGRGKKSYLEVSFEKWLTLHNVQFMTEVHFRNHCLNKSYFADFVFPHLNLVIELDGNQHQRTKEQDAIRDKYITEVYSLNIVRITHKEYSSKSRYFEICKLLSIVG